MIRDPNLFAKFHLRSSVITYITATCDSGH